TGARAGTRGPTRAPAGGGDDVAQAHARREDLADPDERVIAGGVAVLVVQLLQAVRVDDRDRQRRAVLLAPGQALAELLEEDAPVRQRGERIGRGGGLR